MKKEHVYYVGIAAISEEPSNKSVENAMEFLKELERCKDKIFIVLGGYWGLMKVIADHALERGFVVIFMLPTEAHIMPPRRRNAIIVQTDIGFVSRSTIICRTSDVLVVMGGRIGSMIEVFMAYDYGKPVVIVKSGYDTDKIAECFGRYIDSRKTAELYYVENGVSAAKKVLEILGINN
ncbi:MAG: DNA transporter [Thermoplasmata archaeon]|nr:DNA transporter [Euryarchaeota archaeon]RLF66017.1 MAG: DNA transporter [Thermoplasmata archaeon]